MVKTFQRDVIKERSHQQSTNRRMKFNEKIAVIALGKPNAGKSNTWYEIFGRKIRSGVKRLSLDGIDLAVRVKNSSFEETDDEVETYFDIQVINASLEESGKNFEEHLDVDDLPSIVFCSVQYIKEGIQTIDWFLDHGYFLYIQWINPGYQHGEYADFLKLKERYQSGGVFTKWSGAEKKQRATAILHFLRNWVRENRAA
jgi:hypothetical protein